MKLNLLSQATTIIKCNEYDTLSTNVLSNGYTIKNGTDILSWRLTSNTVSSVMFTIISPETKFLNEIEYDLAGGENSSNHNLKIYTSIDYSNWYELPYRYDDTSSDSNLYIKISESTYLDMYKLNRDLTENVTVSADFTYKYAFKKYNSYTYEYEDIYTNHEFKYIRIIIDNLTATTDNPVFFTALDVYINDDIKYDTVDKNLLETKHKIFVQPTIFEEQEFYPDLIKNCLKMYEDENQYTSKLLLNTPSIKIIEPEDDIDGIDYDVIGFDLLIYNG